MTRFTPLESDVLDALASDLHAVAPDLAGQFAESLPGARRNTGSGLFTELIVDRLRQPPLTTATGRFGTVHAMVGDLADPVAFQVELREGRLLALHGGAYGQDTRAIDFARVPFDQVFTVNTQGESIAYDPAALTPPSPLLDTHDDVDLALRRVQDPPSRLPPPAEAMEGRAGVATPADAIDDLSLRIGAVTVVVAGGLILWLVIAVPLPFVLVVGFVAIRFLGSRAGLVTLRKGIAAWRAARVARS